MLWYKLEMNDIVDTVEIDPFKVLTFPGSQDRPSLPFPEGPPKRYYPPSELKEHLAFGHVQRTLVERLSIYPKETRQDAIILGGEMLATRGVTDRESLKQLSAYVDFLVAKRTKVNEFREKYPDPQDIFRDYFQIEPVDKIQAIYWPPPSPLKIVLRIADQADFDKLYYLGSDIPVDERKEVEWGGFAMTRDHFGIFQTEFIIPGQDSTDVVIATHEFQHILNEFQRTLEEPVRIKQLSLALSNYQRQRGVDLHKKFIRATMHEAEFDMRDEVLARLVEGSRSPIKIFEVMQDYNYMHRYFDYYIKSGFEKYCYDNSRRDDKVKVEGTIREIYFGDLIDGMIDALNAFERASSASPLDNGQLVDILQNYPLDEWQGVSRAATRHFNAKIAKESA